MWTGACGRSAAARGRPRRSGATPNGRTAAADGTRQRNRLSSAERRLENHRTPPWFVARGPWGCWRRQEGEATGDQQRPIGRPARGRSSVAAGLLARGSSSLPSLPSAFAPVTLIDSNSPLTVAGAAPDLASSAAPGSLLAPRIDLGRTTTVHSIDGCAEVSTSPKLRLGPRQDGANARFGRDRQRICLCHRRDSAPSERVAERYCCFPPVRLPAPAGAREALVPAPASLPPGFASAGAAGFFGPAPFCPEDCREGVDMALLPSG